MKKVAFFTLVLAIAAIAFSSCKKCETCTAYNNLTDQQVAIDHWCGISIEVNNNKDAFKEEWDFGDNYVECVKD